MAATVPAALSVRELTELFCDHPTLALVAAICDGVAWQGSPSRFQLLAAMFGRPPVASGGSFEATSELEPEWLKLAGLGFDIWRREQRGYRVYPST